MSASAPPSSAQNAMSTSTHQPPRASFMGIPVELRLHVYGYLGEMVNREMKGKEAQCRKCLATDHSWEELTSMREVRKQHLSILEVSKQVFAEAMPVMYARVEVGATFPEYARECVNKVAVKFDFCMGGCMACGVCGGRCMCKKYEAEEWLSVQLESLRSSYPRMTEVRVRMGFGICYETYVDELPTVSSTSLRGLEKLFLEPLWNPLSQTDAERAQDEFVWSKCVRGVRAVMERLGTEVVEMEWGCLRFGTGEHAAMHWKE